MSPYWKKYEPAPPSGDGSERKEAKMATLLVLFNLAENADIDEYEQWAREVDVPTVEGLQSVDRMRVFKVGSVLGSDQAPPYRYFEIIEVNDLEKLGEEVTSEAMQPIAAKFQGEYADSPIFLIAEELA